MAPIFFPTKRINLEIVFWDLAILIMTLSAGGVTVEFLRLQSEPGIRLPAVLLAAGLATTAVGMSVMQTLTERHGPAPLAFLLIPIVGAFFADIANAIVLQAFFALPMLGF